MRRPRVQISLKAEAEREGAGWETVNTGNLFERFCGKGHPLSTSGAIHWPRVILRESLSLPVCACL